MKRALLYGGDDARGLLAAARSLAANGWHVGAATPSRRSLVTASRSCVAWHPDVFAASGEYDVVLPGGDAELWTLSERRDEIACVVPYGPPESVRAVLDKGTLYDAAGRHGITVPPPWDGTGTAVVKSRSHATVRAATTVSADPATVDRAAAGIRDAGAEPLVQRRVTGPLLAVSLVLWDGDVLAAVQQRSSGLWPPGAGISTRAETVPVDLAEPVAALLADLGWQGLAQAQFVESADGPVLLDLNGRCYGSLALAAAAGVDLAAVWASAATGAPRPVVGPALAGVRYQWLYGDLRRGWRESRDVVGPLRYARGAAHSVADPRDPMPGLAYLRTLAR